MPRGVYGNCVVPGCDRAARTARKDPVTGLREGMCEQHRVIAAMNGAQLGTRGSKSPLCIEAGCKTGGDKPGPTFCKGFCKAHYYRSYRAGRIETAAEAAARIPEDQRALPRSITKPPSKKVKNWRAYLTERVLLDPQDGDILRIVAPLESQMIEDRGGKANLTAAEAALITNVTLSRIASMMILRELGSAGAFTTSQTGERVATAALRELPKYLGAERSALQALGLDRRAAPADSLTEWTRRITAGQEAGPIPAELVDTDNAFGPESAPEPEPEQAAPQEPEQVFDNAFSSPEPEREAPSE